MNERATWASVGALAGAFVLLTFVRAWDAANEWLGGR